LSHAAARPGKGAGEWCPGSGGRSPSTGGGRRPGRRVRTLNAAGPTEAHGPLLNPPLATSTDKPLVCFVEPDAGDVVSTATHPTV